MRKLVLFTVLALGPTVASTGNSLFYLGAGITYSSLIASNNGYIAYGTPDLSKNSWKAFAGVRPLNWLAVEADYIDLGSGSTSSFQRIYRHYARRQQRVGRLCHWFSADSTGGAPLREGGLRAGSSIRRLPRTSMTLPVALRSLPWSHRGVGATLTWPGASACRRMSKCSASAWNTRGLMWTATPGMSLRCRCSLASSDADEGRCGSAYRG